jgi:hypothetical protein
MAAGQINGMTTSNVRIDIGVDTNPNYGAKSAADIARILRELADKFESGNNPYTWINGVEGASVDYH